MRVLVTGDSHTVVLRLGQNLLPKTSFPKEIEVTVKPLGRGVKISTEFFRDRGQFAEIIEPDLQRNFSRLPPGSEFDMIGISAPLNSLRIWREKWNGHCLESADLKGSLISQNLLKKIIEDDAHNTLRLLDIIQRTTRVFVVESPWPFRHHKSVGINGEEKVAYIHRAYREYVMAELGKRNIPVVEIDHSWVDQLGFMNPRFNRLRENNEKDQQHGSDEFGKLMMQKILSFLVRETY